jgi:hypothetical protein
MMLVTSGRDVVVANPDLGQFVRTPTARGLPAKYRLFLALSPGPAAKVTGLSAAIDTSTGQHSVVAEVVYPPFAYALSFNGSSVYRMGEITEWASAEHGKVVEQELGMLLGFCYTAFPGDLRTRAQIERTIKDNEGAEYD